MQRNHIPTTEKIWPFLFGGTNTPTSDDAAGLREAFSSVGRVTLRAEPQGNDGNLETAKVYDETKKPVHGRGRGSSRGRDSNGDSLRRARGRGDENAPNFNIDVPPNGYAWWYVDGVDPNSGRAISVIAFIGSVFSPWYKWSGRREPQNNVCINVATYGPGGRFTMTDRGRSALRQTEHSFTVGPSSLMWDPIEKTLTIHVDEISSPPIISRVRGKIILRPRSITNVELPLTSSGSHVWRPFAPNADIEVDLEAKGWQWSGHGYFDANFGTRALEQDFNYWTWGRFPVQSGTQCFYDLELRDGTKTMHAIDFDLHGAAVETPSAPPLRRFKNSLWAVKRETRCDENATPRQVQNLLDAPFYNRAVVQTQLNSEKSIGVFEALDLHRFRNKIITAMLAVRVPRRAGWRFKD